jgi:hypothetical protein
MIQRSSRTEKIIMPRKASIPNAFIKILDSDGIDPFCAAVGDALIERKKKSRR